MHQLTYQTKEKYATINITQDIKEIVAKENAREAAVVDKLDLCRAFA